METNDIKQRAEAYQRKMEICNPLAEAFDYEGAYLQGATEQKVLDNIQWRKDMEYVNVKRQELIDKICNYILTHSTYAVQPTTYVENMKKELELGDTISPTPIQGTGNCMDAHGNFRIVNSPNTPPDRFRY